MKRLVVLVLLALAPAPFLVSAAVSGAAAPPRVDPRAGGLEVGLGEWAVALEAKAIRPGTVTFVVRNRGKVVHAFRIRSAHEHGGGDRFEVRTPTLRPGATFRLTVTLRAGHYEVDCPVESARGEHDALGMENVLSVRSDAPLVAAKPKATGRVVRITNFAFSPATLRVPVGATVKWTNADAAPHTATATSVAFDSKRLAKGASYSFRFRRAGTYAYLCALHPAMKGRIVVVRP